MSIGEDLPAVAPALTPEQLALFRSAPEVPTRAVDAVTEATGTLATPDVMLRVAVRGALEAAASYDAKSGVSYADWAFFHAGYRLWEHLRKMHGGDRAILGRLRAGMMAFLAEHRQVVDPFQQTREKSRAALHAFSDALLAGGALRAAFGGAIVRGEEDAVDVEAARRVGDALRAAVAEERPELQEALRQRFAEGRSVAAIAAKAGVYYKTALTQHHEALARVGARLARAGVKEMPAWVGTVSGEVFEVGAVNDGADAGAVDPRAPR